LTAVKREPYLNVPLGGSLVFVGGRAHLLVVEAGVVVGELDAKHSVVGACVLCIVYALGSNAG